MVILAILIFLVHEHSVSFHLFVSSSVSFISVLQFSEYKFFFFFFLISLGKFIPRYFDRDYMETLGHLSNMNIFTLIFLFLECRMSFP